MGRARQRLGGLLGPEAAGVSLPGSQEGGAGAHWADQVNGQVSAAVVRKGQPGLDMLQSGHVVSLSPAGLHLLPHLQTLADVPAGHKDTRARQPATVGPLPPWGGVDEPPVRGTGYMH